ncbi:hypothetical protein AQUCO_01000401v1 [Aquilegia coerulea]|uniref:Protein kinase domain-containing protein n=1 Tax=Aquilegia coerulea TaxID=218851 RepID=A0A2G5E9Q8_AQUCA|nr:hypothetical protein AQUCO_01000401v1 [Aquilegia coerulea]
MSLQSLLLLWILTLISLSCLLHAQQPYVRKATTDCDRADNSTSVLGYTCNGQNSTCQTYLIFRSIPPYNTVSSISGLLASDPIQLSRVNAVSGNQTFETNKEVIVPVNCSCSGEYYQVNASYVIEHDDTYLAIANNTYQGLSTCQALRNQNTLTTKNLYSGTRITVPIRCACPTKNQTDEGVNYLLSYLITPGDWVSRISRKFSVDTGNTLQANEISEDDPTIYPFTTLLVPLQNSPNSTTINNTWIYIVVGIISAVALLFLVIIIVFSVFFCRRKNKPDQSKNTDITLDSKSFESYEKTTGKSMEESEEFLESISGISQSLKVYKFEELELATENFSSKYWIKGSVYRGMINGSLAAIKKTDRDVTKEINILNKINHFNLIKLSGVCFDEGYWYLVFEYALNGSLTEWIYYNTSTKKVLSWEERMQIALDVASGLNYLHSYTNPPHVHKDIKTSNVLLDSDFRAKIANFSLARSADGEGGEFALTRHIVGTKGYMAPEYLENGYVSPKLDVYSFGIVMLEIVTGKEAAVAREAGKFFLPEALTAILGDENPKEKLKNFIDPSLRGDYPLDLALLIARLIDSCLRRDPAGRPAMDDIQQTLSNISNTFNWEEAENVPLHENSETTAT